jgi:epoxide hydrolase A/B
VKEIDSTMPGLRTKTVLPGAGHWIQQERPREINELMVKFVRNL